MENDRPISFEKALEEMEEIVKTLENGDIELEKSLALYERGVALSSYLKKVIDEGKTRVKVLSEQDDETITEEDFIQED